MAKNGKKNVKIPKLGGGGPPLGNFPHKIPFFSDNLPNRIVAFTYFSLKKCGRVSNGSNL